MSRLFRQASLEDIPAIVDLVNRSYRGDLSKKGWTTEADLLGGQRTDLEMLRGLVLQPKTALLVCICEDQPVGCVALEVRQDRIYLGMLTVDPERQGAGLGREILTEAERHSAEKLQIFKIEMTVVASRLELIQWYERRGYLPTGERRPFPYGDERFGLPKVDDLEFVVLSKQIGPSGC